MDTIRKSFKPHGSYKYSSSCPSAEPEQQPILAGDADSDAREFVVKIDGNTNGSTAGGNANGSNILRESSYDFWKEGRFAGDEGEDKGVGREFSFPNQAHTQQAHEPMAEISEDPPSRLISNFLHKQRASGAEMALDVDLEMDELRKPSSRDPRGSFGPENSSDTSDDDEMRTSVRRRGKPPVSPTKAEGGGGEVLRCTSNSSFQKASCLLCVKTRSRLMDPPTIPPPAHAAHQERKSGFLARKSGNLKSALLGKSGILGRVDDDDEDPFLDDDIPDDLKNDKFGTFAILQLVSLILILAALVCSLMIPVLQRQTVWDLHLWKWQVMVLALICGRLLSGWLIRIVVFFIERNFLLRKRVLYFVYGIKNAVQNCLWLGLVLLTWHYMFDNKVERESAVLLKITKILICLLFTTLVWLVKTLFVKVLASSFHVITYFERIQEALFNQYVIETLSGPPLIEIQHCMEEEDKLFAEVEKLQNAGAKIPNDLRKAAMLTRCERVVGGSGHGRARKSMQLGAGKTRLSRGNSERESSKQQDAISIDHLHKLNRKNVSAWNMKRLIKIVRNGTLTTLDEKLTNEYGDDESAIQIKSEFEAKIAARKIFNNVAKPGSKYIYFVDLMRFMREDEARKTMSLFEGADENSRISRRCLKNWVFYTDIYRIFLHLLEQVNAFRERRALSLTLNDTKTAVNKLHQMANVVVGIIVLGIWLLILDIASSHFFVLLGSQLLLAVFMFGNTLKMTFEAIIFLFVMHPFDVGDRCEIEGVQMVVEEMNILTTIFLRFDNQKITYPNSVLANLPIGNFYRSPDMGDAIDFCVHVSTPVEKLAIMKERIIGYIESKKEHWYPGTQVVLRDVDDMNRLKISIWMRHRINFQDMGLKWDRRELVVKEMIKVLRELDVEYRMLPVDVNVRDMPAITSTRLPSNWTTCN